MPDDFTPEEKKMLAESPADSATFIGDGEVSADDEAGAKDPEPEAEPPAGSHA